MMRVLLLLVACATAAPPRAACAPCIAPSSGPTVLDSVGVRELLAGVELEEGDLRAERDSAITRANIAESYATKLQIGAALGGGTSAVVIVALAAVLAMVLSR